MNYHLHSLSLIHRHYRDRIRAAIAFSFDPRPAEENLPVAKVAKTFGVTVETLGTLVMTFGTLAATGAETFDEFRYELSIAARSRTGQYCELRCCTSGPVDCSCPPNPPNPHEPSSIPVREFNRQRISVYWRASFSKALLLSLSKGQPVMQTMRSINDLQARLQEDNRITPDEVETIARFIASDGRIDIADMKLLVEIQTNAAEVCPEFDAIFFPLLKQVIMSDGKLGADEHFYLLKMLYSDGHIRDAEKKFLTELRNELKEVSPEFEELYQTAMVMPERDWNVGGVSHHLPVKTR